MNQVFVEEAAQLHGVDEHAVGRVGVLRQIDDGQRYGNPMLVFVRELAAKQYQPVAKNGLQVFDISVGLPVQNLVQRNAFDARAFEHRNQAGVGGGAEPSGKLAAQGGYGFLIDADSLIKASGNAVNVAVDKNRSLPLGSG